MFNIILIGLHPILLGLGLGRRQIPRLPLAHLNTNSNNRPMYTHLSVVNGRLAKNFFQIGTFMKRQTTMPVRIYNLVSS